MARTIVDISAAIAKSVNTVDNQVSVGEGSPFRNLFINPQSQEFFYAYFVDDFYRKCQSVDGLVSLLTDTTSKNQYAGIMNMTLAQVNTLISTQIDNLASNFNLNRNAGTKSTGVLVFSRTTPTTSNITIPIGQAVRTEIDLSGNYYEVKTVEEITMYASIAPTYYDINTGLYSIQVRAESSSIGGGDNNVEADKLIIIYPSLNGFSQVNNPNSFSGGTDQETDASLLDRIQLATQGASVGTEGGYLNTAMNVAGVTDALVVKAGDPLMTRDLGSGGKVDVYVLGQQLITAAEAIYVTNLDDLVLLSQPVFDLISVVGDNSGAFVIGTNVELEKDTGFEAGSYQAQDKLHWMTSYIDTTDVVTKSSWNSTDSLAFKDVINIVQSYEQRAEAPGTGQKNVVVAGSSFVATVDKVANKTFVADAGVRTAGSIVAGGYLSTQVIDNVYLTMAPDTGGTDLYLNFSCEDGRTPISTTTVGYYNASASKSYTGDAASTYAYIANSSLSLTSGVPSTDTFITVTSVLSGVVALAEDTTTPNTPAPNKWGRQTGGVVFGSVPASGANMTVNYTGYTKVYTYDWTIDETGASPSGWVELTGCVMTHQTSDQTYTDSLLSVNRKHDGSVGGSISDGTIRIRYYNNSTNTSFRLNLDYTDVYDGPDLRWNKILSISNLVNQTTSESYTITGFNDTAGIVYFTGSVAPAASDTVSCNYVWKRLYTDTTDYTLSSDSIVWNHTNNEQPATDSNYFVEYRYTAPKTSQTNGEKITITYRYNEIITTVQEALDIARYVGADVLGKEASEITIDVTVSIAIIAGFVATDVRTAVQNVITSMLTSTTLGGTLQQSDVIVAIGNVSGVDKITSIPLTKMCRTSVGSGVSDIVLESNEYRAPGTITVNITT